MPKREGWELFGKHQEGINRKQDAREGEWTVGDTIALLDRQNI